MSTTILTPELISQVSLTSPDTNYATSSTFSFGYYLQLKTQFTLRMYISFDIDSLEISASGDINSAYLEIPIIGLGGTASNDYYLYNVNHLWDDTTITWNNQPGASGLPASFSHTYPDDIYEWKTIDVTAQLKQIVADDQNKGFVLMAQAEDSGDGGINTPAKYRSQTYLVFYGQQFDLVHAGKYTHTLFPGTLVPFLRVNTA